MENSKLTVSERCWRRGGSLTLPLANKPRLAAKGGSVTLPYKDFAVVDLFKTVGILANSAAIESCPKPNQKPSPGEKVARRKP